METEHFDHGALGKDEALGQGLKEGRSRNSHAFVHAEQQLQTQGDACVPSEWEDADEACYNGRSQEVLYRRGAVRVSIKHLRKERRAR